MEDPVFDQGALRSALKRSASALKRDGVRLAFESDQGVARAAMGVHQQFPRLADDGHRNGGSLGNMPWSGRPDQHDAHQDDDPADWAMETFPLVKSALATAELPFLTVVKFNFPPTWLLPPWVPAANNA